MLGTPKDLEEGSIYRTTLGTKFHIVLGVKRGKVTTRVHHKARPGCEADARHNIDNGATLQIVGRHDMARIEAEEN